MPEQRSATSFKGPSHSLFLPLAFRFVLALGLVLLHKLLPSETARPLPGEEIYLVGLALFFLESSVEVLRSLRRSGNPFAVPEMPWIRFNLMLDLFFVTFMIAFQGVGQERFATIYIFPVLASAFYLSITEIIGMGIISALAHVASVILFATGTLPDFGQSSVELGVEPSRWTFILGFASLQIFMATLIVVLIRKHLETLKTTLTHTEAHADQLSTLYQRAFASMYSGIIITDLEGRITSANPAAETILQRMLRPGTNLSELDVLNQDAQRIETLEQRFECAFTTPSGERRIVGGNLAPLLDSLGEKTGDMLIFQNLTEIKALEERARMAERLATLGELSSGLAHELRNPLASIQGCIQLLRKDDASPGMQERVLTILKRESDRVSVLVSNFLDFARPRAVKPKPLWLPSLLEDVRGSWEVDPRSRTFPLEISPAPGAWILGDDVCVHQIFSNLLSNACKALKQTDTPSMRIVAQIESSAVCIQFADNGCGMTPEQLRNLFLPFHGSFDEGTGLGMSLVYQFVQSMGWDIHVESEPGRGTTVSLWAPLDKHA